MFEFIDIKGFEGRYQINKNGDVKSLFNNGLILKKVPQKTGYDMVQLCKEGIKYPFLIHRLIATTYIENPENKPMVNHKDGNKKNNSIANLEWVTAKENCRHCWDTGLQKRKYNEGVGTCKLSIEDVKEIRRLRNEIGEKTTRIAEKYNVSKGTISLITNYKERLHA